MSIKNGNLPNADEVMNSLGKIFKNQAQLIFNADLIGLDSDLDAEYENMIRDILSDNDDIDSTNSDILDVPVFGAEVMDNFEDGSVDANIWSSTGTVSESGGFLKLTNASTATADQVNAIDFNQDCTIFTKMRLTGTTTNRSIYIRLIDESAHNVVLAVFGTTVEATNYYRIEIDPTANEAYVYNNSFNGTSPPSATIDISSLTDGDKWHIYLTTDSGDGSGTGYYWFMRYLENAAITSDFVSTATTASETITDAMLVVNKTIGGTSSATYYLSADNGANYEAVTLNEIHRFTNTGTQLKVKISMLNDASDYVYELKHYAVWYNTGAS